MSRNRSLPILLADLREKAQKWSDWEARPYQNEIVKSTEQQLVDELSASTDTPRCGALLDLLQPDETGEYRRSMIDDAAATCRELVRFVPFPLESDLSDGMMLLIRLLLNHSSLISQR